MFRFGNRSVVCKFWFGELIVMTPKAAFPGDFAKSMICQNQFRQRRNRKSPQDFRLSGEGGEQRRMRFPHVALCACVLIDVVPAIRTSSVFRLNCKQFSRNPPRAYRPVRRGPTGPFSLKTLHWSVVQALEPLKTVHWTVFRAFEPFPKGEGL